MAKAMLNLECKQGVTDVLFTPHYYGKKHSPVQFIEKRNAMSAHLQQFLPEGLNAHLGAEVHFTGINVPDYDELCKLAIGNTKYILLEFPFTNKWVGGLIDKVADFVYETGYTPIIAHVERYAEVRKRPAYVTELLQIGCLLQVNSSAFTTKQEKNFAHALLKKGGVHCIGTDTHDPTVRKPNLKETKEFLQAEGYGEAWAKIQTNMQKILQGERIETTPVPSIKKLFGKYF
jgi:protein-tyrosine phosphatase